MHATRFPSDARTAYSAGAAGIVTHHSRETACELEEAAIVVQPGDSGELSYAFSEPGTYRVGCHQPGHYAAGMKIDVTVE